MEIISDAPRIGEIPRRVRGFLSLHSTSPQDPAFPSPFRPSPPHSFPAASLSLRFPGYSLPFLAGLPSGSLPFLPFSCLPVSPSLPVLPCLSIAYRFSPVLLLWGSYGLPLFSAPPSDSTSYGYPRSLAFPP